MGTADYREKAQGFSKESMNLYGVKMPNVHKLSKVYFTQINNLNKSEIFELCETLLRSTYLEEAIIACDWSYAVRKQFEEKDGDMFEKWISTYVNNWPVCDTLCNHTVGNFIETFPIYIERLKTFAHSPNRWMRRAAAVTLIIPARRGKFLDDIFEIANILLTDTDDLVQKGCGWMLKAASESNQEAVFDYVMMHKDIMPRTALRYAIEKMPKDLKDRAMKKENN
jgi:3-methyladenine DNA glycosylase AlkD